MIPLFCAFTFQRKCNETSVNQMHILLILWCRVLSNVHNSRIRYINCVLLIQLLIFYHSPVFYCPNHICTDICVLILLIMNTKWRQSRTKDNSSHRYTHHKGKYICIRIMKITLDYFFGYLAMCSSAALHRYSASSRNTRWKYKPMIPICIYILLLLCSWYNSSWAKNISMLMWCIEVLQSYTRFISFRLLILLLLLHIMISPVFNQGKTAYKQDIEMQKTNPAERRIFCQVDIKRKESERGKTWVDINVWVRIQKSVVLPSPVW